MAQAERARQRKPRLYNGPEETCLRAMVILDAAHPRALSAAELSPFDHAVVHTADFGGPDSLHPALPRRGCEIEVRREILAPALELGVDIGLVERRSEGGATRYAAGEGMPSDLHLFMTPYGEALSERAAWLLARFDGGSEAGRAELAALIAIRDLVPSPPEDWSDGSQALARFRALDAVYASDLARMESLANAAEAISVLRFCKRRDALREAGDPEARTMRHAVEPAMALLRDAAVAELASVTANRRGLAGAIDDLAACAPAA